MERFPPVVGDEYSEAGTEGMQKLLAIEPRRAEWSD